MFNYLFCSLFLLLVCSTSFARAHSANPEESNTLAKQGVDIFKTDCAIQRDSNGGNDSLQSQDLKIQNVDSVFFVVAGDMLVAIAEANYTKIQDKKTIDFVAAYVETTTDNWDKEIFKPNSDNCGGWKTQLVTTNSDGVQIFSTIKNVVYNANESKIYLLVVNKTLPSYDKWEYNVVFSTVSKDREATPIKWTKTKIENSRINFNGKLKDTLKESSLASSLTDKGAFVTKDGKIIFMLRAVVESNKNVIAFIELKGRDTNFELNLLHVENSAKDCYPYLFLLGEKMVMITTHCSAEATVNNNVKESTDLTNWEESSGPFYYSSEFLKDKTSFTTAVINGTNVLLFAQKKENNCNGKKNCFTFWFSDGDRTYNIGENVFYNDEKIVSSSIIYAKDKLLFLHQKSESGDKKTFSLTRLDNQLQNITKTFEKWEKADEVVINLCKSETSDAKGSCSALLLTEGLVGFLSSTKNNSEWIDKYLYKNATITEGTQFENGLKCNKAGHGAKWPVDKSDKNQPYKFSKYGFTLLATLKIDGNIKNDDNSLLGLVLNDDSKRFGLWCTTNGKWAVSIGKDGKKKISSPEVSCKPNKIYFVAFILNNKILSIYVDGQQLTKLDSEKMTIDPSQNVEHFYFGSDNNAQTAVTITSVLLYNRPLEKKITQLKPKENKVNTQTIPAGESNKSPDSERSSTQTKTGTSPPNTPATKDKEEETPQPTSPPPTTEDSAARVGVVGVLCFMLFGVFTLLGRYVY